MTTFHRQAAAEQGVVACTKGAPELVLPCCSAQGAVPLDSDGLLQAAQTLAAQGLRVLALARRDHSQVLDANTAGAAESSLQYLGLIAVIDPPRAEARDAVRDCMAAGITPVMVTGDHPAAARDCGQRGCARADWRRPDRAGRSAAARARRTHPRLRLGRPGAENPQR